MAAEGEYYVVSRSVLVGDEIKACAILVQNGRIASIDSLAKAGGSGKRIEDFGDLVVMPGLVDSHVHVNEPGRTDWEGFWTATRAAAMGGVTTIVDMPLNSIPVTTSLSALQTKVEAMKGQLWVDLGLLGGIIPGNSAELGPMLDAGVVGFKCFMVHSGIDDFPHVSNEDIRLALKTLREKGSNGVYMFHAENPEVIDSCGRLGGDPRQYRTFLNSRPKAAEDKAIETVISLLKEQPYPAHIVHLASSTALDMISTAKRNGLPITAETTYHYLHFEAEKVPDGNTLFKCCPPIRELDNREKLWHALKSGTITQVVSDHSPCTVNLKKLDSGDFMQAWGGISSLQLGLPIVWTGAKQRGLSVSDVSKFCSRQTSQLVNLGRKGTIEVGKDADFVVWDPNASFVVTKEMLHFKNKSSPYEGQKLFGVVKATILRGQKVVSEGKFVSETPMGEWVKRDSKKLSKI